MGWSSRHFDNLRHENQQWEQAITRGDLTPAQRDQALEYISANNQFIATFEGPDGYNEPDRTS